MRKFLFTFTALSLLLSLPAMACKYPHSSRVKTGYTKGENVENIYKEPCHSVVDCRKKGNDLPTRAMFKTRDIEAINPYPSSGMVFDGRVGGYVLKFTKHD